MADQSLYQSQEQRQEQIIAPQQIQSLEYLMAQAAELQAKVDKEMEENPLLEELDPSEVEGEDKPASSDEPREDDEPDIPEPPPGQSPGDGAVPDADLFERNYFSPHAAESGGDDGPDDSGGELAELLDSGLYGDQSSPNSSGDPDYEEKRQHLMDSITSKPSLQEQLMEQLHLSSLPPAKMRIAETIVGSIDERGFLCSHPADLATREQVGMDEIEEVIGFIQDNFDPPGICARDMRECFLLQLKAMGKSKSKEAALVRHHLEDLAHNRRPLIAKKMKISMEELNGLIAEVRKLNPEPARELSADNPVYVSPEVFVERKGDSFVVGTNKEMLPRLRISRRYLRMLDDPAVPQETKAWIKDKLLKAKNVMRCLVQRESTIKRIAEVIVDEQFEFFKGGVEQLKPLTMQAVADKLGLHETTVSRAIAGKYMQTPEGLYEFKFFFSSGYQSASGEEMSSRSVMEKIRDMIADEEPGSPLSDQAISEELRKQGLDVARRTVAKYRELLGIQSSHIRKQHS